MIVFKEYVDDLRLKLARVAEPVAEKSVQYGHQLTYQRGTEKAVITVYYNRKNEFRIVWPHNPNELGAELMQCVGAVVQPKRAAAAVGSAAEADFNNCWAGSDESGKGDFFGSLVVAAVVLNREIALELKVAGVKDCKQLSDQQVQKLAGVIRERALAVSVLELKPEFYNLRYGQVGNLNTLNASGHFHALKNVLQKVPEAEGALIDQFLKSDIILRELRKIFPGKLFKQRPRAEEDMAVAAASVLARAKFLETLGELATAAGVEVLPKGSGQRQGAVAKEIATRLGKDALVRFVKKHFVTYREI